MKDTHTSLPRLAISVAEFCEIFSIGRSTFYEEVKAGRLHGVRRRWQRSSAGAR